MYLMKMVKLHRGLDDLALQLSSLEWCELRLLLTVLEFSCMSMYVQMKLESNKLIGFETSALLNGRNRRPSRTLS